MLASFSVPDSTSAHMVPAGLSGPSWVCPRGLAAVHRRIRSVTISMITFSNRSIMDMNYGVFNNESFEDLSIRISR